jgi:AcrR family transcriptional regulator
MAASWREPPPIDLSEGRSVTARQAKVLDDLEELFLDRGFRSLTVQDLANHLRCSRRTLYDLAPSKDELVLLVIDRLLQRVGRAAMDRMHLFGAPRDRIHAYVATATSELGRGGDAFFTDVAAYPGARRLFEQHYRFARSVCASLIEDGIRQGSFRPVDPRVAAEILYAGLSRLQEPDVVTLTGHTVAEAMDQTFELIMFGLSVKEESRALTSAGRSS